MEEILIFTYDPILGLRYLGTRKMIPIEIIKTRGEYSKPTCDKPSQPLLKRTQNIAMIVNDI